MPVSKQAFLKVALLLTTWVVALYFILTLDDLKLPEGERLQEQAKSAEPEAVLLSAAAELGARCLDGSPAIYYHRKGYGSGTEKWLIYHQAGRYCATLDECLARSKTPLGSSRQEKGWDDRTGYFSLEKAENPVMYNWNMVFLRYCDGGFFTGLNLTATIYQGEELHFRGKEILHAMQQDLLGRGLRDATEVVVAGLSAGGLATFLHGDEWAQLLRNSSSQEPRIVGLVDSGFFPEIDEPTGFATVMRQLFELMNSTAGVRPSCIEARNATGDPWKCIFAQHAIPFLELPTFVIQSIYDSWCIRNIVGNEDPAKVTTFGALLKRLLEETLLPSGQHGIFLDSCSHHGTQPLWNSIKASGRTPAQAFAEWYFKQAQGPKAYYSQVSSYPCPHCCAGG